LLWFLGLFFLIEDDSEFEYGDWERSKKETGGDLGSGVSRAGGGQGGPAGGAGGGGGGGSSEDQAFLSTRMRRQQSKHLATEPSRIVRNVRRSSPLRRGVG
jgi:hypothetical protein